MNTNETEVKGTQEDETPIELPKLTPKEQLFLSHYFTNNWNGTKAAIAAGYKGKSAGVIACELLKKPNIKAHIDFELQRIKDDNRVTHQKQTADLLSILDTDITDFFDIQHDKDGKGLEVNWRKDHDRSKTRNIKKITFGPKGITIELESKEAARDMLNRHIGYYEKDNKQLTPEGPVIYLPDNGRG